MFKVLLDSFISALGSAVIVLGGVGIVGVIILALSKLSWWGKYIHTNFPEFHDERCFDCNLDSCEYCSLND